MITCPRCGTQNVEGTTFCAQCDYYLPWVPPEQAGPKAGTAGVHVAIVSPDGPRVEPGGDVSVDVRVRNTGSVVDKLVVVVTGVPAGWCSVVPETIKLMPGTEAPVEVTFHPPKADGPRAGSAPFTIIVRSQHDPMVEEKVTGTVVVAPMVRTVAALTPQVSRGTTEGEHFVELRDDGNTRVEASVDASDPSSRLDFPGLPRAVTLEPGESETVRVLARAVGDDTWGQALHFGVEVRVGEAAPINLSGVFQRQAKPNPWPLRGLVVAVVMALVLLAVIVLPPLIDVTTVPRLVGSNEGAALAALTEAGLSAERSEALSQASDAGLVVSQSPGEGAWVRRGSSVTYTVGTGPGMTTVPNLIGLDGGAANAALTDAGLVSDSQSAFDPDLPWNQVVSQDPVQGTLVLRGSTVVYRVNGWLIFDVPWPLVEPRIIDVADLMSPLPSPTT